MSFSYAEQSLQTDSPNLDQNSRLSTPVSELDDHRGQQHTADNGPKSPSSAPTSRTRARGNTVETLEVQDELPKNSAAGNNTVQRSASSDTVTRNHATRNGTGQVNLVQTNIPPSQLLSPTQADYCLSPISIRSYPGSTSSDHAAPVARDFEQIMDDGKSGLEPFPGTVDPSDLTPQRRYSRRAKARGDVDRSRESSTSSRSVSPPTSINAFAEGRARERANTFGSKAGSELDLQHQRTISGGTHRRRPTFSSNTKIPGQVIDDSDVQAEEENVYEEEEPPSFSRIDYEALNDFVAEQERGRQVLRKASYVAPDDSSPEEKGSQDVPQIVKQPASPTRSSKNMETGSLGGSVKEKIDTEKTIFDRRPSFVDPPRFSFFSSQLENTAFVSELGHLIMDGESFRDLFELPEETGAWWLDVVNPTKDELEMFREAFGVHPLTRDDILERETREKVELFNNYYFVNFKSFQNDTGHEDYLEGINIYMVVFREGILTFSYDHTPHAADVRRKISKLRNYDSLTADWICYAMVDNIVDFFFPVMRDIENETEAIEDQVFTARDTDFQGLLRQIGLCRKRVMSLMRLLGGKADVIKGFAKRCSPQYSVTPRGDIGLYLSDIQDHIVTMSNNLGHFEKMLSRSHSNYLAQLSVDNLVQGNRANDVLSKITVIATIIVPMNLVCGLFGMNVPVPGNPDGGSLAWFGGIIGFLGFIVLSSLLLAKYFKYI